MFEEYRAKKMLAAHGLVVFGRIAATKGILDMKSFPLCKGLSPL